MSAARALITVALIFHQISIEIFVCADVYQIESFDAAQKDSRVSSSKDEGKNKTGSLKESDRGGGGRERGGVLSELVRRVRTSCRKISGRRSDGGA